MINSSTALGSSYVFKVEVTLNNLNQWDSGNTKVSFTENMTNLRQVSWVGGSSFLPVDGLP
jgi:hypothetical protein